MTYFRMSLNRSGLTVRDLSRPPRGVITPSFHATPPQPSEVQRGLSGGVYGGVYVIVMEWVINVVKY